MSDKRHRIGIIGAGGVGLTCAAFLSDNSDVIIKTRHSEQAKRIESEGITINLRDGKSQQYSKIKATSIVQDLSDVDAIIVAVKSYDTESAAEELNDMIGNDTEIVTVQNGLEALPVLKRVMKNPSRVFGGLTYVGANRTDDTNVSLGTLTRTVVDSKALKACEALSKSGYDFEATSDITKAIWDKMVLNVGQNALGAITNKKLGEMGDSAACLQIAGKLLDEFEEVAKAEGIEFNGSLIDLLKENWKMSSHYPSMWQDLKSKKRTEVDAINGAIVKLGIKHNIETPYNQMITSLIKAVETKA